MSYGPCSLVDVEGRKHLLGIQEGATENAAAVKDLLERLVAQGVDPNRKRLLVIDGSKALAPRLTPCSASRITSSAAGSISCGTWWIGWRKIRRTRSKR